IHPRAHGRDELPVLEHPDAGAHRRRLRLRQPLLRHLRAGAAGRFAAGSRVRMDPAQRWHRPRAAGFGLSADGPGRSRGRTGAARSDGRGEGEDQVGECAGAVRPAGALTTTWQTPKQKPRAFARGSWYRLRGADASRTYSAWTSSACRPFWPCATLNDTFWPSWSDLKPLPWMERKWTNRSSPLCGVMKPKPLASLNHLTVPV